MKEGRCVAGTAFPACCSTLVISARDSQPVPPAVPPRLALCFARGAERVLGRRVAQAHLSANGF